MSDVPRKVTLTIGAEYEFHWPHPDGNGSLTVRGKLRHVALVQGTTFELEFDFYPVKNNYVTIAEEVAPAGPTIDGQASMFGLARKPGESDQELSARLAAARVEYEAARKFFALTPIPEDLR